MSTMTTRMMVMIMEMMIIAYMRKNTYKNNIEYVDQTYLLGIFLPTTLFKIVEQLHKYI